MICSADAAAKIIKHADKGHLLESLAKYYLNCNSTIQDYTTVNSGVFIDGKTVKRLDWLYTTDESMPGGKVFLDFDAYSPTLKVALEYNGPQHYKVPRNASNGDLKKWILQRHNDLVKETLAKKHGIILITIDTRISVGDLPAYIRSRLFDIATVDPYRRKLGILKDPEDSGRYIPKLKPIVPELFTEIQKITSILRKGPKGTVFVPDVFSTIRLKSGRPA